MDFTLPYGMQERGTVACCGHSRPRIRGGGGGDGYGYAELEVAKEAYKRKQTGAG